MDSTPDVPMVFRSVWISDIHLGTKHARVAELLDFLRTVDCNTSTSSGTSLMAGN